MIYTIKILEHSSNGEDLRWDLIIKASSIENLRDIVNKYENGLGSEDINEFYLSRGKLKSFSKIKKTAVIDIVYHTTKKGFGKFFGAGGFCDDFLGARDENGNDVSKYLTDWFGEIS